MIDIFTTFHLIAKKSSDIKLLIPGIIAFYVIMTFNWEELMAGNSLEIIKLILGSLSVIYLLLANFLKRKPGVDEGEGE